MWLAFPDVHEAVNVASGRRSSDVRAQVRHAVAKVCKAGLFDFCHQVSAVYRGKPYKWRLTTRPAWEPV